MLIYKAVNKVNGKIYVGQTTNTLEERKRQHLKKAHGGVKTHFYSAIRKYGDDAFEFSVVCEAKTKEDLNLLETYYIQKYNSIQSGYNMVDFGNHNVMCINEVYSKHKSRMQSAETRAKLSATMKKKIAEGRFFTPEHRRKLSESAKGNHNFGTGDTRSIPCYCIDKITGERHEFHSYKEGGKWWYDTYKPFGETYSDATYLRKIISCIETDRCEFGRKPNKIIITSETIVWRDYRKGSESENRVE